jgi:hypothetical protein
MGIVLEDWVMNEIMTLENIRDNWYVNLLSAEECRSSDRYGNRALCQSSYASSTPSLEPVATLSVGLTSNILGPLQWSDVAGGFLFFLPAAQHLVSTLAMEADRVVIMPVT